MQSEQSFRLILFFSLFFHRFSQCDCKLSKCPNFFIFRWFSGENGFKVQPEKKKTLGLQNIFRAFHMSEDARNLAVVKVRLAIEETAKILRASRLTAVFLSVCLCKGLYCTFVSFYFRLRVVNMAIRCLLLCFCRGVLS